MILPPPPAGLMPPAPLLPPDLSGLPIPAETRFWYVSPSQLATARDCLRKWAFQRILKLRSPPGQGAIKGQKYHKIAERFYKGHPVDQTDRLGQVLVRALEVLPLPGTAGLEVEAPFQLDLGDGIALRGIKDLRIRAAYRGGLPYVGDHKTTSDLQWAKSPEALLVDDQAVAYGYEEMCESGAEACDLQWTFVEVRDTGPIRPARPVWVQLTRNRAEAHMVRVKELAVHLKELHLAGVDPLSLKPSPDACSKYGGCPFRDRCSLTDNDRIDQIVARFSQGENTMTQPPVFPPPPSFGAPPAAAPPAAANPFPPPPGGQAGPPAGFPPPPGYGPPPAGQAAPEAPPAPPEPPAGLPAAAAPQVAPAPAAVPINPPAPVGGLPAPPAAAAVAPSNARPQKGKRTKAQLFTDAARAGLNPFDTPSNKIPKDNMLPLPWGFEEHLHGKEDRERYVWDIIEKYGQPFDEAVRHALRGYGIEVPEGVQVVANQIVKAAAPPRLTDEDGVVHPAPIPAEPPPSPISGAEAEARIATQPGHEIPPAEIPLRGYPRYSPKGVAAAIGTGSATPAVIDTLYLGCRPWGRHVPEAAPYLKSWGWELPPHSEELYADPRMLQPAQYQDLVAKARQVIEA